MTENDYNELKDMVVKVLSPEFIKELCENTSSKNDYIQIVLEALSDNYLEELREGIYKESRTKGVESVQLALTTRVDIILKKRKEAKM